MSFSTVTRTDDPADVATTLERDGLIVLTTTPSDAHGLVGCTQTCFGAELVSVAEPAFVREGGVNDQLAAPLATVLAPHSDGFTYGDRPPDLLGLHCVHACATGGDNFFVDTHELLDDLARDGEEELLAFLASTPIEQTDLGRPRVRGVCVPRTADGRSLFRWFPTQAPDRDADAATQTAQQRLLDRLRRRIDALGERSPRVHLEPGELLWIDNFRMLHAREPYLDPERASHRLWAWSTRSNGLPDEELHSDARDRTTV